MARQEGSESVKSNVLYERDVKSSRVKRRETIAVLGYGLQGRAQASNLSDSGFKVVVGLRKDGKSWDLARSDGHKVMEIKEAASVADILHVLVPDMVQSNVYKEIVPYITSGKALGFSHGAAIHWGWIKPPSDVDVFMVAPKSPGQRVREVYVEGFGTPSLVAVFQDATERAWERTLELAKGIGSARAGLIKTTFKEEVESDWYGEQVDLCGGVDRMLRTSFEVLVESGYQPEVAYFEVLHELKLIVDLIQRYGIAGMYRGVSETARYGGLVVGPKVMSEETKQRMRAVLDQIQSGNFAKEWLAAYQAEGTTSFNKYLAELEHHPIEKVGRGLRALMWPEDLRPKKKSSWSKLQKKSRAKSVVLIRATEKKRQNKKKELIVSAIA